MILVELTDIPPQWKFGPPSDTTPSITTKPRQCKANKRITVNVVGHSTSITTLLIHANQLIPCIWSRRMHMHPHASASSARAGDQSTRESSFPSHANIKLHPYPSRQMPVLILRCDTSGESFPPGRWLSSRPGSLGACHAWFLITLC